MFDHLWVVRQGDKELGVVEAVSRKGAAHAAFAQFLIPPEKQKTISVHKAEVIDIDLSERNGSILLVRTLVGIDSTMPRTERIVNMFVDELGWFSLGGPCGESHRQCQRRLT